MKRLLIVLSILYAALSCTEEPVAPELKLDKEQISISSSAGETHVNVTSNVSWTALSNVQWLTVSPKNGEASESGCKVTLTATANPNMKQRIAKITFNAGNLSKTLEVTQAAKDPEPEPDPVLETDITELSFNSIAGKGEVKITTNKDWTTSCDADWVTADPAEGEASEDEPLTITISVNDNPQEVERTAKLKITAGTLEKDINITQAAKKADVNPDKTAINLSQEGTANTYIVTSPSTKYCFKATVKGNGTPREFRWTFDGEDMTMGYANVAILPSNARLLWWNAPKGPDGWVSDCPVKEGTVTFNEADGHIYFETPETFVNGNAVIAAYDSSNQIVWSWTIWAVNGYDADATAAKVGRYTVMDRNLGAFVGVDCKNESDVRLAAHAYGNFYEWGRKDPFPAPADCQTTAMPQGLPSFTNIAELKKAAHGFDNCIFTGNYADNSIALANELGTSFRVDQAMEVAVRNPHKWMFNGSAKGAAPYMWAVGGHQNQSEKQQTEWRYLWGSVDGINSVKTIYDPCPPGWKIPTDEVWIELFAHPELSAGKRGAYCPDHNIYIPFGGQKKAGDSNITGVTNSIYLASATVTGPWYPTRGDLVYYKEAMVPTSGTSHYNSYGGQGVQVRCVKEDVPETAAAAGKQDGYNAVLMGDSITETWPKRGRASFFTENGYHCAGISGHTTMDMVARFSKDVLSLNPKVVVITAGTNDLAENDGFHVSLEDILNNIRLMAKAAEDYGAKVIIGSVCPSRDFWWKRNDAKYATDYSGDGIADKIVAFNSMLKTWAESQGYAYADYHSVLKNSQNNLKDEYCWVFDADKTYDIPIKAGDLDRVHPGAAGFAEMEKVLKPLIDAALK